MRTPKPKITLRRTDDPNSALPNPHARYRVEKIGNAVVVEHHLGPNGQARKQIVRVGDTIDEVVADHLTAKNEVVTLAPGTN